MADGADRRRSHSASSTINETNTSIIVETAASAGLTFITASSHICLGSVVVSPPVVNSAMVNSSNEMIKAKIAAEMMPGRINGSVMRRNIAKGEAPSVAAA